MVGTLGLRRGQASPTMTNDHTRPPKSTKMAFDTLPLSPHLS
jgi:hypothetical protein